jgi:hypothetical protein
MEVLRDAIWQFIGAILALIALIVTIVLYRKQRAKKLLVWDGRSIVSLLSVHESLENELQITYRGHEVKEAYMASIAVANEGNVPITREDYDNAITLTLSGGGDAVSFDVTNDNIKLNGHLEEGGVIRVDPFLLNSGERVNVRLIIIGHMPKIDVKARIIGGSIIEIEQFESRISQKIKRSLIIFISDRELWGGTLIWIAIITTMIYYIF